VKRAGVDARVELLKYAQPAYTGVGDEQAWTLRQQLMQSLVQGVTGNQAWARMEGEWPHACDH